MINAHYLGEVIYIETDDVKATTQLLPISPELPLQAQEILLKCAM